MKKKPSKLSVNVERNLVIKSRLGNIAGVCSAFTADLVSSGLAEKDVSSLELCVAEVLANVFKHAYTGETEDVRVQYMFADGLVTVIVSDTGNFNEKETVKEIVFDPADRDKLTESGMGLFLVNQIMDEVSYRQEGNKNVFTMKKSMLKK